MNRTAIQVAPVVAAVVLAGVIAVAVNLRGSPPSTSVPATVPAGSTFAPTPTPGLLPDAVSESVAIAILDQSSPDAGALLKRDLVGDASGVVRAAQSRSVACGELFIRGRSGCEIYGHAPGTTLDLVRMRAESSPGFEQERSAAEDTVRYLTDGRDPEVALVASRTDGSFLVVVLMTPGPGLQFPGPLELGGAPQVAVYLVLGPDGELRDLSTRVESAPPLEPIRVPNDPAVEHVILAVTDRFAEWESAWFQQDEADRRTPPAAN